jgi:hypothetical protein
MRFKSAFLFGLVLLLMSCSTGPLSPDTNKEYGSAKVNVQVGKIGHLQKIAEIVLSNLYIVLSAPGEQLVKDTIALTTNGETSFQKTYDNLASLKTWTLSAVSTEDKGNAVHYGTTTFNVEPRHTTPVNLNLNARFSMLTANLYPIRDSVTRCVLLVDGIQVDDSSFIKQTMLGDTIKLFYNYLDTGVARHIEMKVYGTMWSDDTLLYIGDTLITVRSGVDQHYDVKLYWVGPDIPPAGQATMNMTLGRVGTVTVNGYIDPPYQFYKFSVDAMDIGGSSCGILTEASFIDVNGNAVTLNGTNYIIVSSSPIAVGTLQPLFDGDVTVGPTTGNYMKFTVCPWEYIIDMGRAYMFGSFRIAAWETWFYHEPSRVSIYGATSSTGPWQLLGTKTWTSCYDQDTVMLSY